MAIGLLAAVFALVVVWRRSGTASLKSPPPATQATQASPGTPSTSSSPAAVPAPLGAPAREADQIRSQAETEAAAIRSRAEQAAEQAHQGRREVEDEIRAVKDEVRELRSDLERRENRLADREQRLDSELHRLEDRSAELDERAHQLSERAAEVDQLDAQRVATLERAAGLTAIQAKSELVATIENQAKREAALMVRDIEHQARSEGEKRARKVVTLAIQRIAAEQTSESVVSVLHLPGDEMKGRIIGREGRNIRAFETVTGVNLIIDDTPEAVLLSCFDPVRREIARLT
ncbi:MAG TPA: Rnase Y domain-containing protein, partial [Streptosporangiaceae bacterium]|nr:Rnase Y domain-containing protein [Streptosporangiaceae bacterium]